jgi:RNA polymerase sigma factor (sigma-70 family)
MRRITPREREVVRLRFVADLTQTEIGQPIGLSQTQVSRIIRRLPESEMESRRSELLYPQKSVA